MSVFSKDEVESLNAFQESGFIHGFTCGNDSRHGLLVASGDGWTCQCCEYTQDWAHEFMSNWEWKQAFDARKRILDAVKRKPEEPK